ncbi:hypothetical protein [Acinetobacter bereziniae]|uniref:hypothetical protein n=1 Tax=Acinetobacter bereziniae TaxID=106648 RepID=UPI00208E9214|nr:hypothetical protein [Acinetobacter bereziniae]
MLSSISIESCCCIDDWENAKKLSNTLNITHWINYENINYLYVLEQIYNFLLLTPDFKSKTNFEKVVEYFKVLNQGVDDDFIFEIPDKVVGQFGNKKMINIINAPEIDHKNKFLDWVDQQINA